MKICVYECDTIISYGKYKSKSLIDIVGMNMGYIDWSLKNINYFCISEESMRALMTLFPKMILSDAAFKANQFRQKIAKLNDNDVDDITYNERLIEFYDIYNNEIRKNN